MTDKQLIAAYRTMCVAAYEELNRHWEAHTDESGYGPSNLMGRLSGMLPPDLYPSHATDEELKLFTGDTE